MADKDLNSELEGLGVKMELVEEQQKAVRKEFSVGCILLTIALLAIALPFLTMDLDGEIVFSPLVAGALMGVAAVKLKKNVPRLIPIAIVAMAVLSAASSNRVYQTDQMMATGWITLMLIEEILWILPAVLCYKLSQSGKGDNKNTGK